MKTQTAAINEIKIQNVLYATDFQTAAKLALPYALSIAREYNSKIYVVNVIDVSPFSAPGPTSALRAIEAQAIREAKEAVLELSPAFGQVPNEVLIRKGDIGKEISRIVEEKQIDLIVTGSHGREGFSKVIGGSVDEKIFRQAPCPVLTIGPKAHGDPDRFARLHTILLPVDFKPESRAAILYGMALAEKHQARLYLVHVNPAGLPEPSMMEKLLRMIPADSGLCYAPKAFVGAGIPSQEIVDLSSELAVDLIVLGVKRPAIPMSVATHQMTTASKVVAGAECPVITVRGSGKQGV